ncbi:hypothetical protein BgiBS90_017305, partial [Biomphalaria glabrata]
MKCHNETGWLGLVEGGNRKLQKESDFLEASVTENAWTWTAVLNTGPRRLDLDS